MALRGSRAQTRSRDARPAPRAGPMRGDVGSSVRGTVARSASGGCAASRRLVAAPSPRGAVASGGPSSLPLPRGCCSQPVRNSRARLLTTAQLSPIHQESAGHGLPKCQSTCQSAGGTLPRLVGLLVGSFIRLANNSTQPAFIAPRLCAKSSRPSRIPHTGLLDPSTDIYWVPTMYPVHSAGLPSERLHSTGKDLQIAQADK